MTAPNDGADLQKEDEYETNEPIDTSHAGTVSRDDGRNAARIVMLSALVFFTFIFVLQAVAP